MFGEDPQASGLPTFIYACFFWYNILMKALIYAVGYCVSGCIIALHALLLQYGLQLFNFEIGFVPAFVAMLAINLGTTWIRKPDPRVQEFKDFLDKWF